MMAGLLQNITVELERLSDQTSDSNRKNHRRKVERSRLCDEHEHHICTLLQNFYHSIHNCQKYFYQLVLINDYNFILLNTVLLL
jgi:hypothetical protein